MEWCRWTEMVHGSTMTEPTLHHSNYALTFPFFILVVVLLLLVAYILVDTIAHITPLEMTCFRHLIEAISTQVHC